MLPKVMLPEAQKRGQALMCSCVHEHASYMCHLQGMLFGTYYNKPLRSSQYLCLKQVLL
jgi:hypothetical protein